jgi:hypothetical protein
MKAISPPIRLGVALNETQRSKLGLKTYDEIRNWKWYYFLRLLMVSQRVRIYCHAHKEQDIEPSSFVSELLQISRDLGQQELVIELPRLAHESLISIKTTRNQYW